MEAYFAPLEEKVFSLNLENASALLVLGVSAGIENDPIARLDFDGGGFEFHMVAEGGCNPPDECATLFAKPGSYKFLMVHSMHPSTEKPSGEGHFQPIPILGRCAFKKPLKRGIDRFAIHRGDRCDIFGRFQTALDFKGGHTPFDEGGNFIHSREILRREEVSLVTEVL